MFPALLLALAASASFEGGALQSLESVSPDHVVARIPGQADAAGRNHQPSWFYFSISGVRGKAITLDLAGLEGEYDFRPHDGSGHRGMHPAYSSDNVHWRHFEEAEWLENPSRIRVRIQSAQDRIWIARIPPYTLNHLGALRRFARLHPHFAEREIGRSVQKRPLYLFTITDPAVPSEAKRAIWIMARQHAWEAGTSWVMEGAIRYLLSGDPAAARLRRDNVFQMIPTADPDGVAQGGVRFNRNGYDLNRNWDLDDPAKMPEIAAIKRVMEEWLSSGRRIDFFLTLHNTESVDYLAGALSAGNEAIRMAAGRLNASLETQTHFHSPGGLRDSTSATPDAGRMSVDQWVFRRSGAPAFLMELMVDPNPKLGRPPLTQDRLQFGAALLPLIDAALPPARQSRRGAGRRM